MSDTDHVRKAVRASAPAKMTKFAACGCLIVFENGQWVTLVKCV